MQFAVFVSVLLVASSSVAQQRVSPTQLKGAPGFEVHLAKLQPTPDSTKVVSGGETYYLQKQAIVHASDIKKVVTLGRNPQSGMWGIFIRLGHAGGQKMQAATRKHLGEVWCVIVADQIVNCSTIVGVFGARFELTFNTAPQAQRIFRLITGMMADETGHPKKN
ncbi:MAG: SecDF P1 head subdomain-containing protein [Gammaproteobacteria bacterium]